MTAAKISETLETRNAGVNTNTNTEPDKNVAVITSNHCSNDN